MTGTWLTLFALGCVPLLLHLAVFLVITLGLWLWYLPQWVRSEFYYWRIRWFLYDQRRQWVKRRAEIAAEIARLTSK